MSEIVAALSTRIDEKQGRIRLHEMRYAGEAPLSFISAKDRKALGDRLKALAANYCRLAVDAQVERMRLTGFLVDGEPDTDLWTRWRAAGMHDGAAQALTDAVALGAGFVSVWGNASGPTVRVEDPAQCVVTYDPISGEPIRGLKRWTDSGRGYAALHEQTRVTLYRSASHVPEGGVVPAHGWKAVESYPNPLGTPGLVEIRNPGRVRDIHGISDMDLISDLNDALTKLTVDSLVTSEHYARPRRYASGLAIIEDENGNPKNPFTDEMKLWQSEDPETKFGQFAQSDMGGYVEISDSILSQICALSGLPAHYIFAAKQPGSGEEVRAREVSLVSRCERKISSFALPLSRVAALLVALRDGVDWRRVSAEAVWADPAHRTTAEEADAAVKLGAGDRPVLPLSEVRKRLGYGPSDVERLERLDASEAAQRLAAGATL